jgi:hypothetical protein
MVVRADWPAIHADWRRGDSPQVLAERYGLAELTISRRCAWVDHFFPHTQMAPRLSGIDALIQQALDAAAAGDWMRAERIVRLVTGIARAIILREDNLMKTRKSTGQDKERAQARDATEQFARPGSAEHKQLVAELEARLEALSRSIEQGAHPGRGADGQEAS